MTMGANAWIRLGLAALVAAVFAPALGHDFVQWDDPHFVVSNEHVNRGFTSGGLAWAFTSGHTGIWQPLTWLSHMLDAQLFGLNPRGHHATSVLLHLAATLALFDLLRVATGEAAKSALVAALFAIHPLHVESVAWVSERKDVLSALFWMLTTGAYVAWTREPSPKRCAWMLLAFVAGLLSKPMLVTLPFTLLLLDAWPLRRTDRGWRRLVVEKLPLFLLAAAAAVATFLIQRSVGAMEEERFPLALRVENALVSYVAYLGKTLWPADLAIHYPYPAEIATWKWIGAAVLLGAVTALATRERKRRPWLLFGWLWYLGTLVPVIGLVQVGRQAMADRYTYLPLVGIFVIVAWGGAELVSRAAKSKAAPVAAAGVALVALAAVARAQVGVWKDTPTLLGHAIDATGDNFVAENTLGAWLGDNGDVEASIPHLQAAIRIDPKDATAHDNLGRMLRLLGKLDDAEREIREALRLRPDFPQARRNLGVTLAARGHVDAAIVEFQEAVRLDPKFALAFDDLAVAYDKLDRLDDAIAAAAEAVRLEPGDDAYRQDLRVLEAKKKARDGR